MTATPHLFVYGTLRSDSGSEWSAFLGHHATLIGRGRARGILFRVGQYPGMRLSLRPDDWVVGEVYRLNDPSSTWPRIDDYEGSEFDRQILQVSLDGGRRIHAWAYLYKGDASGKPRILSGDFLEPVIR